MGGLVRGIIKFVAIAAAFVVGGPIAAIVAAVATDKLLKVVGLGPKSPKISSASTDRLQATINPRAYRSIAFGHTALNNDVHYQEFTGSNQEYYNQIVTCASHAVQSIDEIWFDDELAWSTGGGVASKFSGYLTVTTRTEGTTANAFTISGSSSWTSGASRMVGLAYIHLRYKLTGNSKKTESPFSSGLTSRITIRGKGAKMYDPRLDSTVGGSGSHRADDQTTWAWVSDDVGRNPALQLLWFLLGWRIQNPVTSAWKLAVGAGLPVERIDLDSFITAANFCDETVTLATTGTEPRYRSDGAFNEGDDPKQVQDNLLAAMNGVLRDAGGKLKLEILHNDLASPVVSLTDADVVGEFQWIQTQPIDQTFNVVRGQYVDASDEGLYQPVDYPDVRIASFDDIERVQEFQCPMVQSASQAQRLAKMFLQREQYPGTFQAEFLASAWQCEVGSVVEFTFPALGFDAKLFRVVEHSIRLDGLCPMVLREENEAIYAWDAEESPAVVPAAPITYDPLNNAVISAINNDLSTSISGPATITINANSSGAITTTLPRTQAYTLSQDGADVTTSTTWSVDVISGTIDASIGASDGILSLNTSGGLLTNSLIRIYAEYAGFTKAFDVSVAKSVASATSSGSTGGTTANGFINTTISTATMVAASDEITVTVGSGGQVDLSCTYAFTAASSSGVWTIYAQWYRWNGSAYVAIGSEVLSEVAYIPSLGGEGTGICSFSDTGLTASSSQKYQLFMRNPSGTVARYVDGFVSGAGS